jgi:beta-lactamase class A
MVRRKIFKNIFFIIIFAFLITIAGGFYVGRYTTAGIKYFKLENNRMKPLRMEGYKYISPLLACETEHDISSSKMDKLNSKLKSIINKEIQMGNIKSVSVFVRDYDGGAVLNINPEEKYYPASLNKVPVMMAAFKKTEQESDFLERKYSYDFGHGFNETVEIQPSDYLRTNQSYTIMEAIKKLIIYSDNNALYFLYKHVDGNLISDTFKHLKVTPPSDKIEPDDYTTVKEYAYFLRVLYNSTYLSQEYSEKALEMLIMTEYKSGIGSGVPKNVKVANKFGIRTYKENGAEARELQDCGIFYKENSKPYLLCVMTKSKASIERIENSLREISSTTYNTLRKNK